MKSQGRVLVARPTREFECFDKDLGHAGFAPEVVHDVDEAARIVSAQRGQFNLVFTLHHVTSFPGRAFDARALVEEAVNGEPRIPVIAALSAVYGDRDWGIYAPGKGIYAVNMPFDTLVIPGRKPSTSAIDMHTSLQAVLEQAGFTF